MAKPRRLEYRESMRATKHLLTPLFLTLLVASVCLTAAASAFAWGARGYLGDDKESVLVVRPVGDRDELWLVNPEDGSSIAAGVLPGHAGKAALSPNGLAVAYLPQSGAARVWLADGSAEARVISLRSAGVRRVEGITWIDDHRLIVSGASRNTVDPTAYRLYRVDVNQGTVAAYRRLAGVDPSAAPSQGKLAYVSFTRLSGGTPPLVREQLKLLSIGGSGAGRSIVSTQYRLLANRRSFARPLLSPDALYFLTGKTAGSQRLTYAVRDRSGTPLVQLFTPSVQAGAWDAAGARAAMGGFIPTAATTDACVWVSDVAGGTVLRTPAGLMGDVTLTSLAWSPSGTRLATEARGYDAQGSSRHLFVLPADLSWFRDLGAGGLPVWIVQ